MSHFLTPLDTPWFYLSKSGNFELLLTIHLTIPECLCKICKMGTGRMGTAERENGGSWRKKNPSNRASLAPSLPRSLAEASINAERRLQPLQPLSEEGG